MTRLLLVAAVLTTLATAARADIAPNDISISSFNPEDAVAPSSTVEGPGIKIGAGTVLRPVLGLETGFVSNVFYDESDTSSAGLLRLIAQIGTASLGPDRLAQYDGGADTPQRTNQGDLEYRANLRLSYDLMLSNNDAVSDTGGLGVGLNIHALFNPMGRFRFGIDEDFTRLIRAANFETDANTNRDINTLKLTGFYSPPDRAFGGHAYFTNTIDIFERGEQAFADRMFNRLGLHPYWQWLPHTQLYGDFSWGWTTGIGSDATKVDSFPLNVHLGFATLLSLKVTLNGFLGYTNGFYSAGPSYSAPVGGLDIGYRYSPLGRVSLGYMYLHSDSLNANYYRDHVARMTLQQLFVPFVLMLQPEVHVRKYNGVNIAVPGIMGPSTRDDIIIAVIAGVHYNLRNWFAATVNYRFSSAQTDYQYMVNGFVDDPSFTRHELLVGVRAAL